MTNLIMHLDYCSSTLFFAAGDEFFPEADWVDLVSADLELWIPGLTSFFTGHTDFCCLDFMDGPFSLQLLRSGNGVRARFLKNGTDCLPECTPDEPYLIRSVVKALRGFNRARFEAGEESLYVKETAILNQLLRK